MRTIKNFFAFLGRDKKSDKSRGLTLISVMMIFGFGSIYITTHSLDCSEHYHANLGLTIMVALAAILCGAFLGFLFGIPRSLQKNQNSSEPNSPNNHNSFADNTNLEQISDWLTKIIVGVSLTQVANIQLYLSKISHLVADGFQCNPKLAVAFIYAVIIFYLICGFIYCYLWTRIQLKAALNKMEVEQLQAQLDESKTKLDDIEKAQFEKAKFKLKKDEKDFKEILDIVKPGLPQKFDDPQKGRWGGNPINNDRELSVTATAHDHDTAFDVTLTVKSTNAANPLIGNVYFFLHDSYPKSVMLIPVENGKAVLELESFEAFTVGAVCDEGKTKLELDINEVPGIPEEYKYT
jgi:uncharacterized membrane protein YciS (DUF1049 family)